MSLYGNINVVGRKFKFYKVIDVIHHSMYLLLMAWLNKVVGYRVKVYKELPCDGEFSVE